MVRALGREVLTQITDVADPAAMDRLAEAAYARFGQVNRLCLNAGLAILKPFEDLQREDWNKVLGVQFGGVLNGVLSFLPRLIAQGGDRHIVVTSSMSGVGRADLRGLSGGWSGRTGPERGDAGDALSAGDEDVVQNHIVSRFRE